MVFLFKKWKPHLRKFLRSCLDSNPSHHFTTTKLIPVISERGSLDASPHRVLLRIPGSVTKSQYNLKHMRRVININSMNGFELPVSIRFINYLSHFHAILFRLGVMLTVSMSFLDDVCTSE